MIKRIIRLVCLLMSTALILSACLLQNPQQPLFPTDTNGGDMKELSFLNNQKQTVNSLSATDSLGRSFDSSGSVKSEKLVGLFYFLWLGDEHYQGQDMFDKIYDISKTAKSVIYGPSVPDSPLLKMHFYAEPLFGYYDNRDEYVVRRQMKLIINAGVDFLAFDTTNRSMYKGAVDVVLKVLEDYRLQGYNVPKIMFMTNTDSDLRALEIYHHIYETGRYKELWFDDLDGGKNPQGKPWITMTAAKANLPANIRDKFYIKDSQWPNMPRQSNGFPWIEFVRPQSEHDGIVSVSVAQNSGMHMSTSVQFKDEGGLDFYNANWGRGYTSASGKNDADRVLEGANFQEQWDRALEYDPRIIFITGWNEWAALKLHGMTHGRNSLGELTNYKNAVIFYDCFDMEFSRDIEPMKGGYGDNFYLQMIDNIRKFKTYGVPVIAQVQQRSIDVLGNPYQWEDVDGFTDFSGDLSARNYRNAAGSFNYTDSSARNDISEVRAAQDSDSLYFLIRTRQDIIGYTSGTNWMNLFIGSGGSGGFGVFDFVINRNPGQGTTSVERIQNGSYTRLGEAEFCVKGRYMQIKVSKQCLNLSGGETLHLKAADNVTDPSDFASYYLTGDSAPLGRLAYTIKL